MLWFVAANPVKVVRTVDGEEIVVRAARRDKSGPLVTTRMHRPTDDEIADAMTGPGMGDVMLKLRQAHRLRQVDAAAAIDVHRFIVSRLETGFFRRNAWMAGFAALYGVDPVDVVFGPRCQAADDMATWLAVNRISHSEVAWRIGVHRKDVERVAAGRSVLPWKHERMERLIKGEWK